MNCLTCRTANNFELVGTTCRCIEGYYLLRTQDSATCEMCETTCLTCSENSYQCTTCDATEFRELNNQAECQCIGNYVEVLGQCLDSTCQNVAENCQQCAYDPATMEQECTDCGGNRMIVNGECVCSAGYYEKEGVCEQCGEGCQQCTYDDVSDILTCDLCAVNSVSNGDGTCSCQSNQLLISSAGILFCQACSSICLTCSGEPDSCDSCFPPF